MFNSFVLLKSIFPIVSIKGYDCLALDGVGPDTMRHHANTIGIGSWNVETLNSAVDTKQVPLVIVNKSINGNRYC